MKDVSHGKYSYLKYTVLTLLVIDSIAASNGNEYFDPSFLTLNGQETADLDLSEYLKSTTLPEGEYLVNIFVNNSFITEELIKFVKIDDKNSPVFTIGQLKSFGIYIDKLSELKDLPENEKINNLAQLIPAYTYSFQEKQLRLDVSIPQAYLNEEIINFVSPKLWDQGIPAFMLDYNIIGNSSKYDSQKNNSLLTTIRGGFNYDAWRLRFNFYNSYYESKNNNNKYSNNDSSFNSVKLYRDIVKLKSNLNIGEINPVMNIFESFPFRGVSLSSSDDMIPYSLRGFSPIISGYANSNATIVVRQNNNVIYQTNVSPGPFILKDIRQSMSAGELDVTITEADGSVRKQIIASSSLPIMERQGHSKYELAAGKYNLEATEKKSFLLGSFIYGLPKNLTVYAGTLIGEDYISAVLGVGTSLGKLGAISFDATNSRAKLLKENDWKTGQSIRVRYAKNMIETGTTIDLAAYRYSTKDYYSFDDVNRTSDVDNLYYQSGNKQKSSIMLSLNQNLWNYGTLSISGNRVDYWDNKTVNNNFSLSYSASVKNINYFVSYNIERRKNEDNSWPEDRRLAVGINIPLSIFNNSTLAQNSTVSYMMNTGNNVKTTNNISLRSSVLDNTLSLGATQDYANDSNYNRTSLNANYSGNIANSYLGYSYSNSYQTLNAGISGGLLVSEDGPILATRVSYGSLAIVDAPGASDTQLLTSSGSTNKFGYAIANASSPYNKNQVGLNITTLPDNVELSNSIINVYPTKDAIVKAKFATKVGYQVLFTLKYKGKYIPFGTIVSDTTEFNSTIAGENGAVYLSGLVEKGVLIAKWGTKDNENCKINYDLAPVVAANKNGLNEITLDCD